VSWQTVFNTTLAIVLAFAAGASISVLGNQVGRKVGRMKLSLYGLRPRHTSTIITALTGGAIAVATLLVALALSGQMAVITQGIRAMEARLKELQGQVAAYETGQLALRAHQPLVVAPIPAGLPAVQVRNIVDSILRQAEEEARRRYIALAAASGESAVFEGPALTYEAREYERLLSVLSRAAASAPQGLGVVPTTNGFYSRGHPIQPVPVSFNLSSLFLVYPAGATIVSTTVDPKDPDLDDRLFTLFAQAGAEANRRGMPNDPVEGGISIVGPRGEPALQELGPEALAQISSHSRPVRVALIAARDLYSLGVLWVNLKVGSTLVSPSGPPAPSPASP
jgi:hypothetical protein